MATLGEQRIGIDFIPIATDTVGIIKQTSAALINICEEMKQQGKDGRTAAVAQTAFEDACMWAVKAATS